MENVDTMEFLKPLSQKRNNMTNFKYFKIYFTSINYNIKNVTRSILCSNSCKKIKDLARTILTRICEINLNLKISKIIQYHERFILQ